MDVSEKKYRRHTPKPYRPLVRYHGGKWRLADWIIEFFPSHKIYVEPFGGVASVLLQKERSYAEIYNDLDGDVVNLFRVLQDPLQREQLIQLLYLTPYARQEFAQAFQETTNSVEKARRFIIRAQMGFGSAGATKEVTGFRHDAEREYTTAMMDWCNYPECLPPIIERLRGVLIENRPALDVIKDKDSPNTLFYVDPPYLPETRVLHSNRSYYRHEMTKEDHEQLIETLFQVQGLVILNGYPSDLYDIALKDWQRFSKPSRASAGRGTVMRTEVVWLNSACSRLLEDERVQLKLFA